MNYHKLVVNKVNTLTPSAKEFVFNIPGPLSSHFSKKAGQFVSLKLNINGQEVRRDYSICTDSSASDHFGIGVKRVENGLVSNFLNDQISEGDVIEVSEPQGRFVNNSPEDQLVLIAAGSGITPILSLLKEGLKEDRTKNIQLLYSSRSAQECMFLNDILSLAESNPKLQVSIFFSKDYSEPGGGNNVTFREGRLHESFIQKQIESNVFSQYANYFVCGPEDLIRRCDTFLKKNFVDYKNIHFELFSSLAPKADKETSSSPVVNSKVNITVNLDGDTNQFEIESSEPILEGLMKNDVDAPFSCQGGVCGACMCTLESGTVDMEENFTLTDDEIEEGRILTCISKPTSSEITLTYD